MQISYFIAMVSDNITCPSWTTKCPWSSCRVTRTLSLSKKHAYKVANFDINYGNAFFLESEKEEGRKLFC